MNTLGHIPKHKFQHAIISCIEAYVNEAYLNEYEIQPTQISLQTQTVKLKRDINHI